MDWLDKLTVGSIVILGLVLSGWLVFVSVESSKLPEYTVEAVNAYTPCEKGYCDMNGFKCLDQPQKAYNYSDCYCTQEGYICKS